MAHMPDAQEIEALKKALADALQHNEVLGGELRVLRTERDLLQEQLNRFKRQLFQAKSEAAGATQQKDLFFNEAEAEGAKSQPAAEETGESGAGDDQVDVPAHKRTKRGRKPLDPALPREVVRHELPEGERVCPHDGSPLREIGIEASEQLDIIPQQVRVIRHERVKYACPCCDGTIKLAARPPQVIPKGLLTEAAQAWVITAKYLDGLPLYRPGRAAGALRGHGLVAQHTGRQRREGGHGGATTGQPAARRGAGRAHRLRRRDRTAGTQGARAQGTDQELPVGADD